MASDFDNKYEEDVRVRTNSIKYAKKKLIDIKRDDSGAFKMYYLLSVMVNNKTNKVVIFDEDINGKLYCFDFEDFEKEKI